MKQSKEKKLPKNVNDELFGSSGESSSSQEEENKTSSSSFQEEEDKMESLTVDELTKIMKVVKKDIERMEKLKIIPNNSSDEQRKIYNDKIKFY